MSNVYKDAMRDGGIAYEVAMRKADNDHRVAKAEEMWEYHSDLGMRKADNDHRAAMENAVAAYRTANVAYENRPQEVKDAEFQEDVENAALETALANAEMVQAIRAVEFSRPKSYPKNDLPDANATVWRTYAGTRQLAHLAGGLWYSIPDGELLGLSESVDRWEVATTGEVDDAWNSKENQS